MTAPDQCCIDVKRALANQAPSTHDPERSLPFKFAVMHNGHSVNDVVGYKPRAEGAMRRREFITLLGGTAATWPLAARAQQGERMRRISVLAALAENDAEVKVWLTAFQEGLQRLGWEPGRNIRIDYRLAGGDQERL